MDLDAVIVLSVGASPDGGLIEEAKQRISLAVDFYKAASVGKIIMTGKNAPGEDLSETHAKTMERYAIDLGVPAKDILKEEISLDTVGQAFFTKRNIVLPNSWKKLLIVSSDYHMHRVKAIFTFIFNKKCVLNYAHVNTKLIDDHNVLAAQDASLAAFVKTFEGVVSGDDDGIWSALIAKHALYKNL